MIWLYQVISSPAEGAKIQIAGGTRPFITGTVDQHYVYVGLSVNMLTTNTSVNPAVGEYYNDSIPQNGTGYWSVKLPGGESLRPGMQKITVWIPFVNLIGEPIVKIFGKPIVVAFICSDRIIVIHLILLAVEMLVKAVRSSNIGKETINENTRLKEELGKHGIYTKIFVDS